MWHQIIKIKFACIGALAITSNLHGQVIRLDRLPEVSHTETASLRRLQDVPWEHLNSNAEHSISPSLAARSQSAESAKAWWEPYVGQSLLPRPSVSAAFFSPDRTSVATLRLEPRPLASNPDTIDWLSLVRERWQAFGDERLTRTLRRHETAAAQHDEYWELYVARCELLIHRRRYNKHLRLQRTNLGSTPNSTSDLVQSSRRRLRLAAQHVVENQTRLQQRTSEIHVGINGIELVPNDTPTTLLYPVSLNESIVAALVSSPQAFQAIWHARIRSERDGLSHEAVIARLAIVLQSHAWSLDLAEPADLYPQYVLDVDGRGRADPVTSVVAEFRKEIQALVWHTHESFDVYTKCNESLTNVERRLDAVMDQGRRIQTQEKLLSHSQATESEKLASTKHQHQEVLANTQIEWLHAHKHQDRARFTLSLLTGEPRTDVLGVADASAQKQTKQTEAKHATRNTAWGPSSRRQVR